MQLITGDQLGAGHATPGMTRKEAFAGEGVWTGTVVLPPDTASAYLVAKRGNQLRVQAAAQAWGRKGARLNTISPGVISTPMGQQELQGPMGAHIQSMVDLSGAGRVGTPDDIAGVAAFLQRHQFGIVAAQMRGAIEDIGDEARLSQWKRVE